MVAGPHTKTAASQKSSHSSITGTAARAPNKAICALLRSALSHAGAMGMRCGLSWQSARNAPTGLFFRCPGSPARAGRHTEPPLGAAAWAVQKFLLFAQCGLAYKQFFQQLFCPTFVQPGIV